jgi:hypothetical protein
MSLVSSSALVLAAGTHRGTSTFLGLAFLFAAGYVLLSFFFPRWGGVDPKTGRPGGREPAWIGATVLLVAIIVGIMVATH